METVVTTSQQPSQEPPTPRLRYVPKPKGSWKKIVGSMKGCEHSEEAFRLGAEWREQMNREGR